MLLAPNEKPNNLTKEIMLPELNMSYGALKKTLNYQGYKIEPITNTTFDMNSNDIRYAKGGRTIAQTPAPKKDRIYGSKVNKVGSASSEKSAKSIVLSKKIIDSLKDKLLVFKQKHPSKTNITIDDLKAVYRRGLGAYSSSHRPTISGGKPNSRNAWAMARVNKFLLKAGGKKVKKAYVQDDDLMAYGGEVAPFNTKTIVSSQSDFQNSFKITLLTKNDDVIGTFAYYIDNEDYTPHHSVEVNPKYRGLGFGKELLLKAIKVANDYELGFSSDLSMTLDQKRVYDSLERDGLISGYLGTFSLTDKGEDYLMENELDMYAKGGKVVVDEKDILKFKKIGIGDVYEIEAIKDIGLQGFNFDKQTILDVINKRFNSLLVGYDDYLVDEDSEAITRAIQNDIVARKEQGDSLENIKIFESYLTNDAQRQRYLDSYRNTQQSTILEWVNYLKQSEYDEAFKYLMLKSVLEYNYDFKTNKLIERTNKTLRNFTNFDAGTLSEIYAQNSKYLLKDYVELQVKNVDAIVKSKNLVKESKDGYWIKFDGGSKVNQEQIQKNAKELSQLVQNTYWCTKTNAYSQLKGGDFYVYVTKADKELLPRIAIRMEGDRVGEVRGNKSSSQDLDEEMMPIAKDFLENNIPNDSGKKWLDAITYNSKCIKLKNKFLSDGLFNGCVEDVAYLKMDEKNYTLDYSSQNGNFVSLYKVFKNLIEEQKFENTNYKANDFLIIDDYDNTQSSVSLVLKIQRNKTKYLLGDIHPLIFSRGGTFDLVDTYDLEIIFGELTLTNRYTIFKSLNNIKIICGSLNLQYSNLESLGNLEKIGGDANLEHSQIKSLGKLKSINGDLTLLNCPLTSLGELEYIGGGAFFYKSKIITLGNLKSINGSVYFGNSKITSLGELKSIGGNANFADGLLTTLGEMQYIGGDATFTNSQITSLGELKSIGGNVYFENSKLTSLGKLEYIGGTADFKESEINSIGKLKYIGRSVYFKNSKITSLGELEYIGGTAEFTNSKITSLGKLKSIGVNLYLSDSYSMESKITSLGELEYIGGDFYLGGANSIITSLGKLKSIGGTIKFKNTKIKSLGKLEYIGGDVLFFQSNIDSLGELKKVDGYADFSGGKMISLDKLEYIGGDATFEFTNITSLGNLEYIGGDAIFNEKINSIGKLKYIGKYIICRPDRVDLFLNLKDAKFVNFDNQRWYDEHKKN